MGKKKRAPDGSPLVPVRVDNAEFQIVGIGASAGGLEPLTQLLQSLRPDLGMALVVVQHLDPHHASALASILARVTPMPVCEATDGVVVSPNQVYVIPPAFNMILEHGQLRLTPRTTDRVPSMPIDTFLTSLASDCGRRSIGVILSGTGTDGSRGLQAIKAERGITFAQDATAAYEGMPQSAQAAGCVDFVLSPEEIAAGLIHRAHQQGPTASDQDFPSTTFDDKSFDKILKLLKKASGIDFLNYKSPTLRRRIERRMVLRQIHDLEGYLAYLADNAPELIALQEEILIHVTSFFRDPEIFEAIKTNVLPALIANHPPDTDLRIWVPGCSSGEEVYSIIICILEYLETQNSKIPIKAFATDVSERAIEQARAGVYPETISADVSTERLQRFFKRHDGGYQIEKRVRDACVFARQDVTQDPPFSQIDLISCRNVLIYLGPKLQSRVFPIFHYALKSSGYLILGGAESIGSFAELFEPIDKQFRFFRRTQFQSRLAFDHNSGTIRRTSVSIPFVPPAFRGYDVRNEADRVVLNRYAPPGVLVDEQLQVIQFRGHTGRFLEPAPGVPSCDLMQMARQGLLPDLRDALESAKLSGLPTRKESVQIGDGQIRLEVIPILVPNSDQRYFVVLFEEVPDSLDPTASIRPTKATPVLSDTDREQELARMKEELAATRAYLQSVIEAKDVSNEELTASNEEVISNNEELQSTNEELETAKEELQATNEELETVNEELESRIQTTIQLNDDLANLITSVRIPIVIIGQDLRVRRFSPRARDVLNLIPGDVGRVVTDLTLRINVPDLRSLIMRVLDTLEVYEQEVTDLDGCWYSLLIRPFRTSDNKIDGVTILLIDINTVKDRERQISEARDFAWNIVESLHESLLVLDDGLRVRKANHVFYENYKMSPELTENQLVYSLDDGQWNIPELRSMLDAVLMSNGELLDVRVERDFVGIGKHIMSFNACPLQDHSVDGRPRLILLAIEDITAREEAVRSLKKTELMMQTIVKTAVSAIITIDERGIVQAYNEAAEIMFGYPAADVIGNNLGMLMPEPYRAEHIHYIRRYLETGVGRILGVGRVVLGRRRNGTTFPAELGLSEIVTPDGRLFTGILLDISERRALEREVLAIAIQAQQRIGQDLHDTTGQELTGLSYLAQSLAESLRAKKLPEAEISAKLVAGLESALTQVRGIAKGLIPVAVDSEGLMTALESLAEQIQSQKKIACQFYCESPVLLEDTRSATQLFLIAREAVNNCVKHASPHQIHITLSVVDSNVVLEISDDGIGIDKSMHSHGVGMHIMAYRAGAMNGTIDFQPKGSGGTSVVCRIPLPSKT